MSRSGSNTARTPRSTTSKVARNSGGLRPGCKEKIQPRGTPALSVTRKATESFSTSGPGGSVGTCEPPPKPSVRNPAEGGPGGPGTSPQRRPGEVCSRRAEPTEPAPSRDAPVFRWQGPDDFCRQEIEAAVQKVTAKMGACEGARHDAEGSDFTASLNPPSRPMPLSPAPSTVDMRGSLENPSSAPSPLSGGGAWELSDSSHQSLNISTSSCKEDMSVDENEPPPEYLVPTPRTFSVNGSSAGGGMADPLAPTMKTVSTMRSFWESKARENAGSKDLSDREARWSRVSNVECARKNAQGPPWLKKEISKLQARMDANKERLLEMSTRLHGQEDNCLDDEHSTRCSRSPSSKSSCTIFSDSDASKSQDNAEDDELLMSLKSLRRDFTKVNRKTVALFEEVMERCLPRDKIRLQKEALATETPAQAQDAHSYNMTF